MTIIQLLVGIWILSEVYQLRKWVDWLMRSNMRLQRQVDQLVLERAKQKRDEGASPRYPIDDYVLTADDAVATLDSLRQAMMDKEADHEQ